MLYLLRKFDYGDSQRTSCPLVYLADIRLAVIRL